MKTKGGTKMINTIIGIFGGITFGWIVTSIYYSNKKQKHKKLKSK